MGLIILMGLMGLIILTHIKGRVNEKVKNTIKIIKIQRY